MESQLSGERYWVLSFKAAHKNNNKKKSFNGQWPRWADCVIKLNDLKKNLTFFPSGLLVYKKTKYSLIFNEYYYK